MHPAYPDIPQYTLCEVRTGTPGVTVFPAHCWQSMVRVGSRRRRPLPQELHVRGRVTRLPTSRPRCSSRTHIFPACRGPRTGGHSGSETRSGVVRRGRRVALWPSVTTPSPNRRTIRTRGTGGRAGGDRHSGPRPPALRVSLEERESRYEEIRGTACAGPDTVRGRRADRLGRRPAPRRRTSVARPLSSGRIAARRLRPRMSTRARTPLPRSPLRSGAPEPNRAPLRIRPSPPP